MHTSACGLLYPPSSYNPDSYKIHTDIIKCCKTMFVHVCLLYLIGCSVRTAEPSGDKPGYCPLEMDGDLAEICIDLCQSDLECPDEGKCCSNGCGKVCVPALSNPPTATNTSGRKPQHQSNFYTVQLPISIMAFNVLRLFLKTMFTK